MKNVLWLFFFNQYWSQMKYLLLPHWTKLFSCFNWIVQQFGRVLGPCLNRDCPKNQYIYSIYMWMKRVLSLLNFVLWGLYYRFLTVSLCGTAWLWRKWWPLLFSAVLRFCHWFWWHCFHMHIVLHACQCTNVCLKTKLVVFNYTNSVHLLV